MPRLDEHISFYPCPRLILGSLTEYVGRASHICYKSLPHMTQTSQIARPRLRVVLEVTCAAM